MNKEKFQEFEKSIHNLADKLPQWKKDSPIDRRMQSAYFSLLEEAGEISGLISKKRIRKHYWETKDVKTLEDYSKIKEKFIDETGDFLWVFICSCYSILDKKVYDKLNIFDSIIVRTPFDLVDDLSKTYLLIDDIDDRFVFVLSNLYQNILNLFYLDKEELINIIDREDKLYMLIKYSSDTYFCIENINKLFSCLKLYLYLLYQTYNITLNEIIDYNMNKLDNRYDDKGQRKDGK